MVRIPVRRKTTQKRNSTSCIPANQIKQQRGQHMLQSAMAHTPTTTTEHRTGPTPHTNPGPNPTNQPMDQRKNRNHNWDGCKQLYRQYQIRNIQTHQRNFTLGPEPHYNSTTNLCKRHQMHRLLPRHTNNKTIRNSVRISPILRRRMALGSPRHIHRPRHTHTV